MVLSRISRLSLGLLALTCAAVVVGAVVEDDWWKDNWKRQFVGVPTHIVPQQIESSVPNDQALIVATSSSVIASLSSRGASILWRQVLPETEIVRDLVSGNSWPGANRAAAAAYVSSLSIDGAASPASPLARAAQAAAVSPAAAVAVRVWHATSGVLAWERKWIVPAGVSADAAAGLTALAQLSKEVVVVSRPASPSSVIVAALDFADGKTRWEQTVSVGAGSVRVWLSAGADKLTLIAASSSSISASSLEGKKQGNVGLVSATLDAEKAGALAEGSPRTVAAAGSAFAGVAVTGSDNGSGDVAVVIADPQPASGSACVLTAAASLSQAPQCAFPIPAEYLPTPASSSGKGGNLAVSVEGSIVHVDTGAGLLTLAASPSSGGLAFVAFAAAATSPVACSVTAVGGTDIPSSVSAVASASASAASLTVAVAEGGKLVASGSIVGGLRIRGDVVRCHVVASSASGYVAYLTAADDSLTALPLSGGAATSAATSSPPAWTSEQALARPTAAALVDLPSAFEIDAAAPGAAAASASTSTSTSTGGKGSAADDVDGDVFPSFFPRVASLAASLVQALPRPVRVLIPGPIRSLLLGASDGAGSAATSQTSLVQGTAAADSAAASLRLEAAAILTDPSTGLPLQFALAASPAAAAAEAAASLHRDVFGLRQLLLVATASGKILALRTDTAELVWSRFVPASLSSASSSFRAPVFARLRTHRFLAVLTPSRSTSTAASTLTAASSSVAVLLDPMTGALKGDVVLLPGDVVAAVPVPYASSSASTSSASSSSSHDHVFVVVTRGGTGGSLTPFVLPSSRGAEAHVRAEARRIHFHVVDVAAGKVDGYQLRAGPAPAASAASSAAAAAFGGELLAQLVWSKQFGATGEVLAGYAPVSTLPVHSATRAVGEFQGALLKYLNPAQIVLATTSTAGCPGVGAAAAAAPAAAPAAASCVVLHVMDSVTGAVTVRIAQRGARGPVHVAQWDNTVIAHYFSEQSHQHEITAIELYEGRGLGGDVASSSAADDAPVSSYLSGSARPPLVLQQTYALPHALRVMAPTQTRAGITYRDLIAVLASGRVAQLPRPLLDPRRPQGASTQADQEEGLVPYNPLLETPAQTLLSVNRTVARGALIASAATSLESTSLVAVVGLDIFARKTQPSGGFDVLSQDFGYAMLGLTVAAILVGTVMAKQYSNKQALAREWD